jgi:hypothetical protein
MNQGTRVLQRSKEARMSSAGHDTGRGGDLDAKHPAQYLALTIGVLFVLVGLAGFAVTGFDGFADPDGDLLLGAFEVNPLHNIVHVAIGAAGIALWTPLRRARVYGWVLAVGYGATFVYGLFVAGSDHPLNVLAINEADNWLHVTSALLGLVVVLWSINRVDAAADDGDQTRPG